jgi:hypothetical protein
MLPLRPENRIATFLPGVDPASGINRKAEGVAKPVYPTLAEHQRAETDWDFHPLHAQLDAWWNIIDDEFGLRLPRTVLRLDTKLRTNCAGYFRPGHNELGLLMEIAIGVPPAEEMDTLDFPEVLGTLAHEMLHLDQELNGHPGKHNYHNRQYQQKAAALGLRVDGKGHQTYDLDGPFLALIRRHGVEMPRQVQIELARLAGVPLPPMPVRKKKSRSKLRKWSCKCPQNVRVGAAIFIAHCPRCESPFVPQ